MLQSSLKLFSGLLVASLLLVSCLSPKPFMTIEKKVRQVEIPLSAFAKKDFVIIQVNGGNSIFVRKSETDNFAAYRMRCSRGAHDLEVKGKHLVCPEDGSRFDFNGKAVKGPANESLILIDSNLKENEVVLYIREITG